MPIWMWGLLALGFLLFGGLIVMLVNRSDEEFASPPPLPAEVSPSVPDRLAELPQPVRYEAFPGANEPPRVLDAAVPGDLASLDTGLWLLLFADPTTAEGRQTLQAAHELHRRVSPRGVRVVLVLPRAPYQRDGELLPAEPLAAALRADGGAWLRDGIHVVLDPTGEAGRGLLHERHASASVPVTAVLLNQGATERRTMPPEGGFTLQTLAPIAVRALELVGDR